MPPQYAPSNSMDNPKDQTLPAAALQQPAEDSNLTTGDANSSPIYHAGDGFGDDNDYYFVDDIDESPEYLPENWPPRILRRIAQYLPTPKDRLEFSLVHPNWTSFGLEVLWQEPELTSPKAFYKFMRAARASPMRAQSIRGLQLTLDESVAPLADGNATNNNNSDGAALVAAALEGLSATGMLKEHRAVAQTSLGSQRMLFEMIRNVDNIERLAFYGYNTHDRDFIHLARRAGTLRKLEVIGLPEQAPRTMIPFFRTLTRLAFISIQLDALSLTADVSYDALWRGLEIRADRLVELNLRVPSISRANIEGILNKCRELRILRLVSDRPSGSGGGIELHDEVAIQAIDRNSCLEVLALYGTGLTSRTVIAALTQCSRLRHLEVVRTAGPEAPNLEQAVSDIPVFTASRIETLVISGISVDDQVFAALAQGSRALTKLGLVNIPSISTESLVSLLTSRSSAGSSGEDQSLGLKGLRIVDCPNVTDAILVPLADESLPHRESLLVLHIQGCEFTSAIAVGTCVKSLPNLSVLHITGTEMVPQQFHYTFEPSGDSRPGSVAVDKTLLTKFQATFPDGHPLAGQDTGSTSSRVSSSGDVVPERPSLQLQYRTQSEQWINFFRRLGSRSLGSTPHGRRLTVTGPLATEPRPQPSRPSTRHIMQSLTPSLQLDECGTETENLQAVPTLKPSTTAMGRSVTEGPPTHRDLEDSSTVYQHPSVSETVVSEDAEDKPVEITGQRPEAAGVTGGFGHEPAASLLSESSEEVTAEILLAPEPQEPEEHEAKEVGVVSIDSQAGAHEQPGEGEGEGEEATPENTEEVLPRPPSLPNQGGGDTTSPEPPLLSEQDEGGTAQVAGPANATEDVAQQTTSGSASGITKEAEHGPGAQTNGSDVTTQLGPEQMPVSQPLESGSAELVEQDYQQQQVDGCSKGATENNVAPPPSLQPESIQAAAASIPTLAEGAPIDHPHSEPRPSSQPETAPAQLSEQQPILVPLEDEPGHAQNLSLERPVETVDPQETISARDDALTESSNGRNSVATELPASQRSLNENVHHSARDSTISAEAEKNTQTEPQDVTRPDDSIPERNLLLTNEGKVMESTSPTTTRDTQFEVPQPVPAEQYPSSEYLSPVQATAALATAATTAAGSTRDPQDSEYQKQAGGDSKMWDEVGMDIEVLPSWESGSQADPKWQAERRSPYNKDPWDSADAREPAQREQQQLQQQASNGQSHAKQVPEPAFDCDIAGGNREGVTLEEAMRGPRYTIDSKPPPVLEEPDVVPLDPKEAEKMTDEELLEVTGQIASAMEGKVGDNLGAMPDLAAYDDVLGHLSLHNANNLHPSAPAAAQGSSHKHPVPMERETKEVSLTEKATVGHDISAIPVPASLQQTGDELKYEGGTKAMVDPMAYDDVLGAPESRPHNVGDVSNVPNAHNSEFQDENHGRAEVDPAAYDDVLGSPPILQQERESAADKHLSNGNAKQSNQEIDTQAEPYVSQQHNRRRGQPSNPFDERTVPKSMSPAFSQYERPLSRASIGYHSNSSNRSLQQGQAVLVNPDIAYSAEHQAADTSIGQHPVRDSEAHNPFQQPQSPPRYQQQEPVRSDNRDSGIFDSLPNVASSATASTLAPLQQQQQIRLSTPGDNAAVDVAEDGSLSIHYESVATVSPLPIENAGPVQSPRVAMSGQQPAATPVFPKLDSASPQHYYQGHHSHHREAPVAPVERVGSQEPRLDLLAPAMNLGGGSSSGSKPVSRKNRTLLELNVETQKYGRKILRVGEHDDPERLANEFCEKYEMSGLAAGLKSLIVAKLERKRAKKRQQQQQQQQ